MSGLLLASFLLLLVGAAGTVAAGRIRPDRAAWVGVAGMAVSGLLWLLFRGQLPWTWASGGEATTPSLPQWLLTVDAFSWQASAWLMLLGLAFSGQLAQQGRHRDTATVAVLTAAGCLPLWAGTVAGWLTGTVMLLLVWSTSQRLLARPDAARHSAHWSQLSLMALALPLVWLGAALTRSEPGDLALAALPASPWVALAAAVLLVAPLWFGWRARDDDEDFAFPIVYLSALPATSGVALLARAVDAGPATAATTVLLSVLGMLGLLMGVLLAWRTLDAPRRAASAMVLALAGLLLMTAGWADGGAVMGEGRVLVLALGAVWLTVTHPFDLGRRVAAIFVGAAVAGLPLTAAIAGRAALVESWVGDERWLLLLVTVALLVPLVAAVLSSLKVWTPTDARAPQLSWLWMLLPLVGLLSLEGLLASGVFVWVGTALIGVLGAILSQRAGTGDAIAPVIRQGLAWDALEPRLQARPRGSLAGLKAAVREAVNILESEGGMLWLLLFLIVFWLARGS